MASEAEQPESVEAMYPPPSPPSSISGAPESWASLVAAWPAVSPSAMQPVSPSPASILYHRSSPSSSSDSSRSPSPASIAPTAFTNLSGSPTCSFCETTLTTTQKCGQCNTTVYCSRECQVKHWKLHKPHCRPNHFADPDLDETARLDILFHLAARHRGVKNFKGINIFNSPSGLEGYFSLLDDSAVYCLVTDAYRLYIYQKFLVKNTSKESAELAFNIQLRGFRTFLDKLERCKVVLPESWNQDKRNDCEEWATRKGHWSYIGEKVTEKAILEYWHDQMMVLRLGLMAERATGEHIGNYETRQVPVEVMMR